MPEILVFLLFVLFAGCDSETSNVSPGADGGRQGSPIAGDAGVREGGRVAADADVAPDAGVPEGSTIADGAGVAGDAEACLPCAGDPGPDPCFSPGCNCFCSHYRPLKAACPTLLP